MCAAREQEKITDIHTKGAEREILDLLDQYDIPRVIVRWYSRPLDNFREMVTRGVYFTLGLRYCTQITYRLLHKKYLQENC